jgi:hypothetical protein
MLNKVRRYKSRTRDAHAQDFFRKVKLRQIEEVEKLKKQLKRQDQCIC